MKHTGKKQNEEFEEFSDTECLEVLSDVASQLGIEDFSGTVHGRKAEAVTIARELFKDLKRLIDIDSVTDDNDKQVTLTKLEQQVLQWAALGKSMSVTAQIMCVTERSVRSARESIRTKLNTHTLVLSIAKAKKLGLL